MNWTILIIIGTQILFTGGDLLARNYMPKQGFVVATFLSGWFLLYFLMRTIAMFGQLFVLTTTDLGKSAALFGAASIVLANVLGFLVLKEVLTPSAYIGVSLAIVAFIVLALT